MPAEKFCPACKAVLPFEEANNELYCSKCGRSEAAAEAFLLGSRDVRQSRRRRGLLMGLVLVGIPALFALSALLLPGLVRGLGARRGSSLVGAISATLGLLAIPLWLWTLLLAWWEARSRIAFAFRISLWVVVVVSGLVFSMGGLGSALGGFGTRRLESAVLGCMGFCVVLAPIGLGIGWLIALRRFPGET